VDEGSPARQPAETPSSSTPLHGTPDQHRIAVLAELETARQTRDQAISERDKLAAAWTELAAQLAAEQEQVGQQRRRAEAAEQQLIHTASHIEHLTTELTTTQEQVKRWQAQAAEHRAELADAPPELTTGKTARNHGPQHLTAQHTPQHTRSRTNGQRPKLGPRQVELARQMYDEFDKDGKRRYTIQQIADAFGVTGPTISRHVRKTTSKTP
jgi:predicted DNA binding protein